MQQNVYTECGHGSWVVKPSRRELPQKTCALNSRTALGSARPRRGLRPSSAAFGRLALSKSARGQSKLGGSARGSRNDVEPGGLPSRRLMVTFHVLPFPPTLYAAVGNPVWLGYPWPMPAQVFRHPHRVTYADCTVGNHLYYARYLDLLEAARGEFFRHLGAPFARWQEEDALFPVIECRLRYKAAARYDDVLTTELWLTELGRVRLAFAYRILKENQVEVLEASTLHACTSLHEKPRRLPEELTGLLRPYVCAA